MCNIVRINCITKLIININFYFQACLILFVVKFVSYLLLQINEIVLYLKSQSLTIIINMFQEILIVYLTYKHFYWISFVKQNVIPENLYFIISLLLLTQKILKLYLMLLKIQSYIEI